MRLAIRRRAYNIVVASPPGGERRRLSRRTARLAHAGGREQRAHLAVGYRSELAVERPDGAESPRNAQAHHLVHQRLEPRKRVGRRDRYREDDAPGAWPPDPH